MGERESTVEQRMDSVREECGMYTEYYRSTGDKHIKGRDGRRLRGVMITELHSDVPDLYGTGVNSLGAVVTHEERKVCIRKSILSLRR